jgi:hypothetical protein
MGAPVHDGGEMTERIPAFLRKVEVDNRQQPWDFIVQNNIPFLEGTVVEKVCNWRTIKDLEEAKCYLEKLIEVNRK